MSDAITMTPLASVAPVEGLGMIQIRADLALLAGPIGAATGIGVPAALTRNAYGARSLLWMSPDELLLILPVAEVKATVTALEAALAGQHHLVADVSDMRCAFALSGRKPAQVLAKLCPLDLAALPANAVRRTRAAQIACAVWPEGQGWRIIAFRSVAEYLRNILTQAASPGTDLDPR